MHYEALGHVLLRPEDCACDKQYPGTCPVCNGGLAVCIRCNGGEIDLETPCDARLEQRAERRAKIEAAHPNRPQPYHMSKRIR